MLHIEISYSGTDRSEALDAHIREQVTHQSRHFADRLTRAEVHISDTNAGKGGMNDKRCVLEMRPRGMDPITVVDEGADHYAVVSAAALKMQRVLSRTFEKLDAIR